MLEHWAKSVFEYPKIPLNPKFEDWYRLLSLIRKRVAFVNQNLNQNYIPIRVILGPTGVGKSSVVNSAFGKIITRTDVIRPCTLEPQIFSAFKNQESIVTDSFLKETEVELEFQPNEDHSFLQHSALVDSPDFDSISETNLRWAKWLMMRADSVIFVISPDKYGDKKVWDILDTIKELKNVDAIILNKYRENQEEALNDLSELLQKKFNKPFPVLTVPFILHEEEETINLEPTKKNELANLIFNPLSREEIKNRLQGVLSYERKLRLEHIEPWLEESLLKRKGVLKSIQNFKMGLPIKIAQEIPLQLDETLRQSLVLRFQQQVEKIDFLKKPREWINQGFSSVKGLLFGENNHKENDVIDHKLLASQQIKNNVYECALRWHREVSEEVNNIESHWQLSEIRSRVDFDLLTEQTYKQLSDDLVVAAEEIAQGLPWLSKLGFYGVQIAIHCTALIVFVKTGGLTGGEVVVQGLSSPLLAKLAGHMISSGEAANLQSEFNGKYLELMSKAFWADYSPLENALDNHQQTIQDYPFYTKMIKDWEKETKV